MDSLAADRRTGIWQTEGTAAEYHGMRDGIPYAADQIDIVRRVLDAHGSRPASILDVGCGDGIMTAMLCEVLPIRSATLVDYSPPMLAAAHERFATARMDVCISPGDLADRAWVDTVRDRAPFELIVSRFAIHHLTDERKRVLYRELFELLDPDGWFVNIEHVASLNRRYQRAFDDWMIESIAAIPGTNRSRAEVAAAYEAIDAREANILASVEVQLEWLRTCGFVDVDCPFKAFELAVLAAHRPGHSAVTT